MKKVFIICAFIFSSAHIFAMEADKANSGAAEQAARDAFIGIVNTYKKFPSLSITTQCPRTQTEIDDCCKILILKIQAILLKNSETYARAFQSDFSQEVSASLYTKIASEITENVIIQSNLLKGKSITRRNSL